MGYEPAPGKLDRNKGTLYTFDLDGRVKKHFDGIDIANGLAWTADNKTLYYIDSFSFRVDAFDYDGEAGKICEISYESKLIKSRQHFWERFTILN